MATFGLFLAGAVTTHPTPAAATTTPYYINRGPNRTQAVVLSYDDCPNSLSEFKTMVVGVQNLGKALVLFPTGRCIQSGLFDPAYARSHGHYVFNHSINHPHFRQLTKEQIKVELGAPGVVTNVGRPPYGEGAFPGEPAYIGQAYAELGMVMWSWNVDPNDWRGYPERQVTTYVIDHVRVQDTVLLHMQEHAFNLHAYQTMLDGLASKGLRTCVNPGPTPVKLPDNHNMPC